MRYSAADKRAAVLQVAIAHGLPPDYPLGSGWQNAVNKSIAFFDNMAGHMTIAHGDHPLTDEAIKKRNDYVNSLGLLGYKESERIEVKVKK
jgi:hypothetical protein